MTIENFVEGPWANGCVHNPEDNSVEDPVNACENEIFLNEVSAEF